MVKLSELKDDAMVIDKNLSVYDVEEVKGDLRYFKDEGKKLYTTTEYHAHIDARDMLESAIESEYDNMYDGWDENISHDITDNDIRKLQVILDDILSRSENIAYYQDEEIEVDIGLEKVVSE